MTKSKKKNNDYCASVHTVYICFSSNSGRAQINGNPITNG